MLSVEKEECGSSKSCIEEKISFGQPLIIIEKWILYDGTKYFVKYLIINVTLTFFIYI